MRISTTSSSSIVMSLIISCMAIFVTSCDYISSDDRYIKGPEITVRKAVLLEDFTGQNCLNCPEAHAVIEQLQEQFGEENVIPVSIHCGDFGISVKRTNFQTGSIGLMTDEGNAILETYGISSFPMGVINFGKPITYDLWPTAVRNALQVSSDVEINLSTRFGAENDPQTKGWEGDINVSADIISSSSRIVNVQFWIVENNLVAQQRLPDGKTDRQYVHNNVFRAQMFPELKGKQVSLPEGISTNVTASIPNRNTDKEIWFIFNLDIVCIVSDSTGVLQVKRTHLNADHIN